MLRKINYLLEHKKYQKYFYLCIKISNVQTTTICGPLQNISKKMIAYLLLNPGVELEFPE